jgi:hypothetical protein
LPARRDEVINSFQHCPLLDSNLPRVRAGSSDGLNEFLNL